MALADESGAEVPKPPTHTPDPAAVRSPAQRGNELNGCPVGTGVCADARAECLSLRRVGVGTRLLKGTACEKLFTGSTL